MRSGEPARPRGRARILWCSRDGRRGGAQTTRVEARNRRQRMCKSSREPTQEACSCCWCVPYWYRGYAALPRSCACLRRASPSAAKPLPPVSASTAPSATTCAPTRQSKARHRISQRWHRTGRGARSTHRGAASDERGEAGDDGSGGAQRPEQRQHEESASREGRRVICVAHAHR